MGAVRTRMFCCCLPVRFGAACSALINFLAGVAFSAVGWYGVHQYTTHQVSLDKDEEVALILFSITYTLLVVTALLGLIGSLGAIRSLVKRYAVFLVFNTLLTIGVGIYWIWRLFHRDANECSSLEGEESAEQVVHYVCKKGFETIRIVIVIVLVIVWLFQIAGIAIVFDYVGQLNEEAGLGDDEKALTNYEERI
ncbi:predicted protein [Sparassis crispa]|uniref:MARVEL domain-containing protein n=1 Tax=Sparassis crispa TaxID=139825 RepID=A0A401GR09_9APHY|nr:predicted protein [Sparassis crispa]GBE84652.1 predicted protein [Sparassis crispa]